MAGNGSEFISKSIFKKLSLQKKEEERDVISWSELPIDGAIYKIDDIEQKQGRFGECYILTFKNKLGAEGKVWCPRRLQREFDEESKKSKPRTLYFCTLGQNKKQDGSGHVKNEYESCFR